MDSTHVFTLDHNSILSVIGALLISLGLITSESSLSHKSIGIFSALLFICGWILYLLSQRKNKLWLKGGLFIPIIAMLGQLYFMYVAKNTAFSQRRAPVYFMITMLFWMVFMALWFYYGYNMSLDDETYTVSTTRSFFVWIGIALLMLGMMGYFFYRNFDWFELTGGVVPSMKKQIPSFGMFNPFVSLIGFGWAMLAFGPQLKKQNYSICK